MAALTAVTRVFNGETITIIPDSSDVSVQTDGGDFTASTSAFASCATNHKFNAEFLRKTRVWVEFNGEHIHFHSPDCIAPHNDEEPKHLLPRCWKQTEQDCVPIEEYKPNQALENSMQDTLSSYIENKEWNNAYQTFFQMLPRITSEQPLPVIRDLTGEKSGLSESAKATIAVGLFWLGLQSVREREELAKACYLQGLNILKTIGLTEKHPGMALRVKAHLADLYQKQRIQNEEIDMRKQIVKELKMHDDAIHSQLARLLELDPDTDLGALGIKSNYPEKFLTSLAGIYRNVKRPKAEAVVRVARLQQYFNVTSPECRTEMSLIIESNPDQNIYDIFPDHKYPSDLLFAIAAAFQKQEKTKKEIEARVMALKLYHKPDSVEFKTQISGILKANPNFDPNSVYNNRLPACALLHIAGIYRLQENKEEELKTLCMAIRLHMLTNTSFDTLERLVELDPDAECYSQLHHQPHTRQHLADEFSCKLASTHPSWAHTLMSRAFNEDPENLVFAKKMLSYATKAEEEDNAIAALCHVLRLGPTQENIQAFLQYCESLEKLPESAVTQLMDLPKVEPAITHSNNLMRAAKILEKTQVEQAQKLATQASTHCMTSLDAHKYLLSLFKKINKQSDAVDLLVCIAKRLKTSNKFLECSALLKFLTHLKKTNSDLKTLCSETPYMDTIAEQDAEIKALNARINELQTSMENRLTALEGKNGYALLPDVSTLFSTWQSPANTPRESTS